MGARELSKKKRASARKRNFQSMFSSTVQIENNWREETVFEIYLPTPQQKSNSCSLCFARQVVAGDN
jgi:hypothetical protein